MTWEAWTDIVRDVNEVGYARRTLSRSGWHNPSPSMSILQNYSARTGYAMVNGYVENIRPDWRAKNFDKIEDLQPEVVSFGTGGKEYRWQPLKWRVKEVDGLVGYQLESVGENLTYEWSHSLRFRPGHRHIDHRPIRPPCPRSWIVYAQAFVISTFRVCMLVSGDSPEAEDPRTSVKTTPLSRSRTSSVSPTVCAAAKLRSVPSGSAIVVSTHGKSLRLARQRACDTVRMVVRYNAMTALMLRCRIPWTDISEAGQREYTGAILSCVIREPRGPQLSRGTVTRVPGAPGCERMYDVRVWTGMSMMEQDWESSLLYTEARSESRRSLGLA
ncbi:hypothetical protein BV25DRAFT_1843531 [Artomyces pyxidatus]|uniref:Uncharacterized protein n=1 Tax=Artomyces pyxidatus TaxID=48021 RepID=A0ACB8SFZ8_9AGAM|nr:hypothetical protein BV25DRAFT_1843531 [Artomyces pyxidatus]